jgi:hypothetical protein
MKYGVLILIVALAVFAETLFEVKDASNNKVLDVSTDGLRVLNNGDTLMVISADAIRANISSSKGLSRSFSVTTASSKGKGLINALQVDAGSATMTSPLGQYTDFSPENIFLGLNSGTNVTPRVPDWSSGIDNVFIGNSAGLSNTSGFQNTYIGINAGRDNQTQFGNVYVGSYAGEENVKGGNTFVGMQAGRFTEGTDGGGANTFLGYITGRSAYGDGNTFIGMASGELAHAGVDNVYVGHIAGYNTPGGNYNVYLGKYAGYGWTPNSGSNNVYVGQRAGISATGSSNVFLGSVSGAFNTGSGNVFLGNKTGENENGSNKLFIDNSNTSSPLIYGDFAADSVKINGDFAVSGKTYLNTLDVSSTLSVTGAATLKNTLNVASDATFNGNKISLIHPNGTSQGLFFQNTFNGNTDSWHLYQSVTDAFQLYYNTTLRGSWDITTGVYSASSDERVKKNVEELTGVTDKIMKLRPKKYNFTSQKNGEKKYIGLIAQDVMELFPEFVYYHKESDSYTMDYAGLSVVAIQALKEQKSEIDELRKEIMELRNLITK